MRSLPLFAFVLLSLVLATAVQVCGAEAPSVSETGVTEKTKDASEQPPGIVGFDLGTFYLKETRAAEGANTRLSFTLHAAVYEDQAKHFEQLLASRTHRVRDQVITAARITEPLEFGDPQLERFRRRMLVRLSRSLPELAIEDLYLSEFRYLIE